ncbi:hypothetical protein PIROE2DRAFT_50837 [Piromyces sp. E2]|nr:hypothetical protein PIROE2DRAFT_50837 [Piromyces sp. E2]|eukprot:OUM66532.1 hypothetical protein PIROE2DRAFT_50837 [Piromyces sp. E2]
MEVDLPNTPNTPKNVHFDNKGKEVEDNSLDEKDSLENSEEKLLNSEENTNSSDEGENVDDINGDEEDMEDGEFNEDDEFQNVKDRQEAINVSHPFGLRLWKPALYKKHRSIFTKTHEALHSQPNQSYTKAEIFLFPGNIIWAVTFGWMAALTYLFVNICLLIPAYVILLFGITHYIFWPFGKYIERVKGNFSEDIDYYTAINEEDNDQLKWDFKKLLDLFLNNGISGFFFYFFMFTIITPMHLIVAAICWMFVVSIPMSKLNFVLLNHLLNEPLELFVHSSNPPPFQFTNDFSSNYQISGQTEIILCTYRAIGLRYYKYTFGGINVIFFNSLLFVVFTLLDAYIISPSTGKTGIGHPLVIFFSSLISVIPLAYFIGMSVSSITAQTNLALGAVINATFGSIIEVILYTIALAEGKAKIVEGSLIGSVLTGILALPGMSMLTGGIKRKEQRFNAKSAGVSSTLLILSIIGIFTPTLFQKFYGSYNLVCEDCPDNLGSSNNSSLNDATTVMTHCRNCRLRQPDPLEDPFYHSHTKYLVWICAVALVLTYGVGLLFTLRTHVKQIYAKTKKNNQKQEVGHEAPSWTKWESVVVLLVSTIIFSLLAEILIGSVDVVLKSINLDEKFLGVTLFALAPNVSEFYNAIAFAMYGNIALSLEIGSAYATQVAMLQIPAIIGICSVRDLFIDIPKESKYLFTLIFSKWDVVTIIIGVFLLSHVYTEGKSNYFKGAMLLMAYSVFVISYYFIV